MISGKTTAVSTVVYRTYKQAWSTLNSPELSKLPQVEAFLDICQKAGMDSWHSSVENPSRKHITIPFIVLEGLDGTGKTTLTRNLAQTLKMEKMCTPPKTATVQSIRAFFDDQNESVRRAYYSMGNYLAAQDVISSPNPVVMDRYWHSTAAYAVAHPESANEQIDESNLVWPVDLLQPNLVIFLTVSEEERIQRHKNRKNFTNTEEEKTLAKDAIFRQNLIHCYKNIVGPRFIELNVDGSTEYSTEKVLKIVKEHFPSLHS